MKKIIIQIIIPLFAISFFPIVLDAQKLTFHQYSLRVSMGMSQTAVDDWKQGEVVAFDWNG